ncbi:hypothetical protein [Synechococcus phage Yong-M2-251]|nr:hypothetical protein [Synechococcus phage Yong-M2-251]
MINPDFPVPAVKKSHRGSHFRDLALHDGFRIHRRRGPGSLTDTRNDFIIPRCVARTVLDRHSV